MTAEMPPMGRGAPSTNDSSGSTVALALASPSSSMTCTCSRSSLALCSGSNTSSQSEMLLSKAATARRASASTSPSLYLRSSIILRTVEIRQDSTRSAPPRLAAGLALLRLPGRFPPLDGIRHPPAPLGVLLFVADAAPQRSVGGEPRGVRAPHLRLVLVFHPGSQRLVVRELLLTL